MFSCCCADNREDIQSSEITTLPADAHCGEESRVDVRSDDVASTATPPSGAADGKAEESKPQRAPIKGGVFKPPPKREEPPAPVPMTLPKSDHARRSSVPIEAELGSGAYLVYEQETNSLYAQWSRVPVEGAVAWLRPLVQVPGHKFNLNKGKCVLTKEAQNTEKYCGAWVTFLKITREYPSKLMLMDNFEASGAPPVQVLILENPLDDPGKTVTKKLSSYGVLYDMMKNVKAVAVVPATSTLIPLDEPMEIKIFLQRGTGEGAAVGFDSMNA
ncbi:hypothetical protein BESB_083860 [Besnoitia besnoiti]|uniref:Immune mapped protein 2 N-terminal domain-containing protein n=1 Tax=Besnoitia besnoiti TaxID=94643 RepID=A0A2A9MC48_BESBE|nr:hypothetical protein BESB_083860 [Besnoitia besnoiti]PFH33187.1 hypothetical protein BESB_083860 [Besnoitia besnoiti]